VTFPSLTHLVNRKGKDVTEHPTIPTDAQTEAMDDFIDAMNLVEPNSTAENPHSSFDVNESFSPAIHNIQNTLLFRMANTQAELPPPPEVLTRFMRPPKQVREMAKGASERLKAAMDVKYGKQAAVDRQLGLGGCLMAIIADLDSPTRAQERPQADYNVSD